MNNNKYKWPKISVFLPFYYKEYYLKNSINSQKKQTLKNIEIIAVNDGSTDIILNSTRDYLMNMDPDDKLIDKNDLCSLYKMQKLKIMILLK